MHNFMVHTYSGPPVFEALLQTGYKQAKTVEAECLAEEHAASVSNLGLPHRVRTLNGSIVHINCYIYIFIIKGCYHKSSSEAGGFERLFDFFLAHDYDLKTF